MEGKHMVQSVHVRGEPCTEQKPWLQLRAWLFFLLLLSLFIFIPRNCFKKQTAPPFPRKQHCCLHCTGHRSWAYDYLLPHPVWSSQPVRWGGPSHHPFQRYQNPGLISALGFHIWYFQRVSISRNPTSLSHSSHINLQISLMCSKQQAFWPISLLSPLLFLFCKKLFTHVSVAQHSQRMGYSHWPTLCGHREP